MGGRIFVVDRHKRNIGRARPNAAAPGPGLGPGLAPGLALLALSLALRPRL